MSNAVSNLKGQVTAALAAQAGAIDELHKKLASLPGCDQSRLAQAVAKYKAAHEQFADDAQACVMF